ncbi:MAG: cytochrome P450 [Streptosporangiales bacterium]|nr:cytochrome P450 [Streptosporangiales bacterium]
MSRDDFWARPHERRHAAYARLRAMTAPLFFEAPPSPYGKDEGGYYALVRHADIVEASRNPRIFSSASGTTSITDRPAEMNEFFGSMIHMDDPRHGRLRRIVSRGFTPRMIRKFEEDVQKAAAAIAGKTLAAGTGEFVADVAARLPLKVICDMMGVGDEHYDMVLRASIIILAGGDPELVSQDMDTARAQLMESVQAMTGLMRTLAAEREAGPRDDLISALVSANVDGERLTPEELGSFFILLTVAGNETTRNALSHALVLLTEHPDQREFLMADFEGRIDAAVEEVIRYASPIIWMRRTVTADTVLNGQSFAEGDKVLMFYQSANRDEAVFTDPDRFDITRSPNPHVGFGGPGPHFCLGAHLARREIRVMLRELLTRAPAVRASGDPAYLRSSFLNGIKRLPYEF